MALALAPISTAVFAQSDADAIDNSNVADVNVSPETDVEVSDENKESTTASDENVCKQNNIMREKGINLKYVEEAFGKKWAFCL